MKTDVSDSGGTEVGQFGILQALKCDELQPTFIPLSYRAEWNSHCDTKRVTALPVHKEN
jgi:hypothetical protein